MSAAHDDSTVEATLEAGDRAFRDSVLPLGRSPRYVGSNVPGPRVRSWVNFQAETRSPVRGALPVAAALLDGKQAITVVVDFVLDHADQIDDIVGRLKLPGSPGRCLKTSPRAPSSDVSTASGERWSPIRVSPTGSTCAPRSRAGT